MTELERDRAIRATAFAWLSELRAREGDVLRRSALLQGFEFAGGRVGLMSPQQGIWKPQHCRYPLSIATTLGGPYSDVFDEATGRIRYSYQGDDPNRWDNAALRRAGLDRVPMVYLRGVVERGLYVAFYPAVVVDDDPAHLTFWVQVDDPASIGAHSAPVDASLVAEDDAAGRRAYITSTVRRRLHQASFRTRVIRAYREMCALCRLRHVELLDAAHITPDWIPTASLWSRTAWPSANFITPHSTETSLR